MLLENCFGKPLLGGSGEVLLAINGETDRPAEHYFFCRVSEISPVCRHTMHIFLVIDLHGVACPFVFAFWLSRAITICQR